MINKPIISKKVLLICLMLVFIGIGFFGGIALTVSKNQTLSQVFDYVYTGTDIDKERTIASKHIKNKDSIAVGIDEDIDFDLFWEIWRILKSDHIDKNKEGVVTDKKLFYGSLKGLVNSVDDPYSAFLDPGIKKKFDEEMSGSFEGIGAEIGIKNRILTIITPLPGTPAEKIGLRAGDRILKIDKKDTIDMPIDVAVSLIRGKKGTSVTLKIFRDIDQVVDKPTDNKNKKDKQITEENVFPKDFIIVRDKIVIESVVTTLKEKKYIDTLAKDRIAYIKIASFHQDTVQLFKKEVMKLLAGNKKRLILDLRNNPGGYLDTAIEIAAYWLGEDKVIVKEIRMKRDREEEKNYYGASKDLLKDIKTVVLINEGSASGSEIVAGALQDYKKGKLVGKKTFGKGSVQELRSLPDGSALKLTIAKWFTPHGRSIHEIGIMPDIEVDLKIQDINDNKDPQLEKAIEIIKTK